MLKSKFIRDKNYLLLFFGNLTSGIGSRVYGFGISLYLLDLTGSATATAIYFAVWTVIMFVCSPIAATFTDRFKYKAKVLYLTDFGRGVCYGLAAVIMTLAINHGQAIVIQTVIYTMVFFIAIQTAFFAPAVNALTPQIVEKEELVSASSIMQITHSIQNLAGLFFGALLYLHFGIVVLIIINAVSFFLSAISEMFIKVDEETLEGTYETKGKDKKNLKDIAQQVKGDLKTAIIYLFKQAKPILMIMIIILLSATLVTPWFSIGVPYMFKEYFTFTVFEPEYLLASSNFIESVGIILMSLVVSQIAFRFKIFQILRFGGVIFFFLSVFNLIIIMSLDREIIQQHTFIVLFLAFSFIAGLVNATINAPINASLYKYIDKKVIGKVSTLINSISGIFYPITAIVAGYLIDYVNFYIPLYIAIFAMFLLTMICLKSKNLQKLA
mgnify:CR=1 FL=1